MTDLSPAAQAVLDAVLQKSNLSPAVPVAAAALRAAADQVVPPDQSCLQSELKVWCKLRNIANELDGGAR